MNDSLGDCQSHRADRSIFSAEKIQDRWFKVSAAASVGASVLCTEVSTGHPHPSSATKKSQIPFGCLRFFLFSRKILIKHYPRVNFWEFAGMRKVIGNAYVVV